MTEEESPQERASAIGLLAKKANTARARAKEKARRASTLPTTAATGMSGSSSSSTMLGKDFASTPHGLQKNL